MEGGSSIPGSLCYGGFDLQGSVQARPHNHQPGFPLTIRTIQTCDHLSEYSRRERGKNLASDDDEPSFTEDDDNLEGGKTRSKKGSPWQRVKWTDRMVRTLITAISYCGEDVTSTRRKSLILLKKGKWKSISKVMAERGFHVSPQQCEDKFNDLNKRYKRLNDVLGRGTSCQVVENPTLLDMLDFLTEKEKDDVRKILNSKHLFYEEMCSYHNGNRLHLPHDPALQRSLHLALKCRDDHEDDSDEDDDHDEYHASHGALGKRLRHNISHPHTQIAQSNINQALLDGLKTALPQQKWFETRLLCLQEKELEIKVEMLELKKQRHEWERFSRKRDTELENLRMENVKMNLENERLALELKRKGTRVHTIN